VLGGDSPLPSPKAGGGKKGVVSSFRGTNDWSGANPLGNGVRDTNKKGSSSEDPRNTQESRLRKNKPYRKTFPVT